jgi:hypothetical protein
MKAGIGNETGQINDVTMPLPTNLLGSIYYGDPPPNPSCMSGLNFAAYTKTPSARCSLSDITSIPP